MDMEGVDYDDAKRILEFYPGGKCAYQARPRRLLFEHFPESPVNSFFLLECSDLEQTGVGKATLGNYEEVVELSKAMFAPRSVWDQNFVGLDENGYEIPLPPDARLIVRYHTGKFLMVAKASLWNRESATYDGRHNRMAATEIRNTIEIALRRIAEIRKAKARG